MWGPRSIPEPDDPGADRRSSVRYAARCPTEEEARKVFTESVPLYNNGPAGLGRHRHAAADQGAVRAVALPDPAGAGAGRRSRCVTVWRRCACSTWPTAAPATRATSATWASSPTTTTAFADPAREQLTAERVKEHFGELVTGAVDRYEMPNIRALNFVCHGASERRRHPCRCVRTTLARSCTPGCCGWNWT